MACIQASKEIWTGALEPRGKRSPASCPSTHSVNRHWWRWQEPPSSSPSQPPSEKPTGSRIQPTSPHGAQWKAVLSATAGRFSGSIPSSTCPRTSACRLARLLPGCRRKDFRQGRASRGRRRAFREFSVVLLFGVPIDEAGELPARLLGRWSWVSWVIIENQL